MDKIILIFALLALLIAAFGQWRGETKLIAAGWLGVGLYVLTYLV